MLDTGRAPVTLLPMRAAAGTVLVVVLLGLLPGCGTDDDCRDPQVSLSPDRARVGEQLTVTMDRVRPGPDCPDDDARGDDLVEVPVSFVQGDTRVELGRVAGPGEGFGGAITVPVPAQATPGAAQVTAGDDDWLTVPFTVVP